MYSEDYYFAGYHIFHIIKLLLDIQIKLFLNAFIFGTLIIIL